MKVREVITIKGWVDGSGWSYSQCIGDDIIEIDDIPDIFDWSWWETGEKPAVGGNTKIIVEYYAPDADTAEDEPLATYATWESDLFDADADAEGEEDEEEEE